MQKITSRDNQRLKLVRKARDGRNKDIIFIEGVRLVFEALRSNLELLEVFISEDFFSSDRHLDLLEQIELLNIEKFSLTSKILNTISDTKSSQGIILTAKTPTNGKELIESEITNNNSVNALLLLLHEINNPSNLGAILRTAEAANVQGIITTKSSANVFSPKALRGSMGASFRLPIWENADFDEAIDWAGSNNLTTICADINAETSYLETNWNKDHLLVFGSEAHGLSETERSKIDEKIYIPMANNVESLNLAVSCGIILFEAKKNDQVRTSS